MAAKRGIRIVLSAIISILWDTAVVSLLTAGMQQLVKERPEDPVAFLADYLTANNPSKKA